ncbi:hypothetical protein [uncultured Robinsoniella sp.]|uniref:hypothetical protein n=1 Tax=uncultured Robinsoniella sp. TaxID=904190 RepID=UPI00374F0EB7
MLYKLKTKPLSREQFKDPGSEYRGAPFWAWNCRLKREQLLKQISYFKEMGMGGFHIHCRAGLDTQYMGSEFLEDVKACKDEAKKQGLLCWLYDEDRWPSGSAGGMVTCQEEYRSRFLVFQPENWWNLTDETPMSAAKAVRSNHRTILARYEIELDKNGYLKRVRRLQLPEEELPLLEASCPDVEAQQLQEGGTTGQKRVNIWTASLEISGDTPWFNNQAYVNSLDKDAINRFIELTHEAYYRELGQDFGGCIPAIFTDEPQTSHKEVLDTPFTYRPVILPFTDDFEDTFYRNFGMSILDHLPELIWETGEGKVSRIRYLYHLHVCQRFSEAFGDHVGAWCREHGIALTGHMMNEWTLHSQTMAAGEVMRPMKEFGLPGIDMLCDRRELSTAKQAQSVAHQYGREGVMSEIYGVTGWDFDFRSHKLAGDWQAALGVTVRVPHLTWVSMEGEGKRDYPASIGYQSPWYQEYSYIENHFARLATVLTRGVPVVRIGVIHPVESYWMYWGNQKQTASIRQELEYNFSKVIDWMLYGLLDFDFISEALLNESSDSFHSSESLHEKSAPKFCMGEMNYEVVIIPGCCTLRSTTVDKLDKFTAQGGKVIFMGNIPRYVDAVESDAVVRLAQQSEKIQFSSAQLLEALKPWRDVDICVENTQGKDPTRMEHVETGIRAANMFYQLREETGRKWLFVCHVNKPRNEHITHMEKWEIWVEGIYSPVVYDTLNGETRDIHAEYEGQKTKIIYYGSQHDSLLLELKKEKQPDMEAGLTPDIEGHLRMTDSVEKKYLPQPQSYRLTEPNVCLLDMAEYAFDNGEFMQEEEILRIDNLFRKKLGLPLRMEALAQPWTQKGEEKSGHTLKLGFTIHSETEVESAELAMEHPEDVEMEWNGERINNVDSGWYVDECIRKRRLGRIKKGENRLVLHIPFQAKTNVEWCYLLGNFGVQVSGRNKKLIKIPERICYGSFVNQGFPFYAGNMEYEVPVYCKAGRLFLETSHYRGALITAELDKKKSGIIALAPYILDLGEVEEGWHSLTIRLYGNRINAFGAVHNADAQEEWYGPNLWRTAGNKWSYEYQLKEMGILTTPKYWIAKKEKIDEEEI